MGNKRVETEPGKLWKSSIWRPSPDNLFKVKIVDQFNTLHKLNSDEKLLARLETHMEMVVVAFDRLSALKYSENFDKKDEFSGLNFVD